MHREKYVKHKKQQQLEIGDARKVQHPLRPLTNHDNFTILSLVYCFTLS
jgi:hypothetical protein